MAWARAALISIACILSASAQAMAVGQAAPDFSARLIDGSRFELREHRGDVVLINYWATWCEPCMAEFTAFKSWLAAHPDAGVRVVTVSMDDPEQRARIDQAVAGLPFSVAMDGDVTAPGYGRIWRLPMSFIVDRGGLLRFDGGQGEQKPLDLPALERLLDPLLSR